MAASYQCKSEIRREAVRKSGAPRLNGIDFLEVGAAETTLAVTFIHNLPDAPANPVPDDDPTPLKAANVTITGGVRIKKIRVLSALRTADNVLTVTVDGPGDFSPYTLSLVSGPDDPAPPHGIDPRLSEVQFTFKVECLKEFDCKTTPACPPPFLPAPPIDYLAKDYASFRQLMLDRMALRIPRWAQGSVADVGTALVELLAYVGDSLSYWQDAVATEAYLGTARRRTSIRRHARLVDYFMHDGCNARAWVQIRAQSDVPAPGPSDPAVPSGTKLLTRLPDQANYVAAFLPEPSAYARALAAGCQVYETMFALEALFAAHNAMPLYTWGETECCLPRGATAATLKGTFPDLRAGDVLILAEALNPSTGGAPDADPTHRHPVRLLSANASSGTGDLTDPLTGQAITEITWHPDDALPFPLCVSARTDATHGGNLVEGVTVALGNVVLVDHGRRLNAGTSISEPSAESLGTVPPSSLTRTRTRPASADPSAAPPDPAAGFDLTGDALEADDAATDAVPPRYRPTLGQRPLTQAGPAYDAAASPSLSAAAAMKRSMDDVRPAIALTGSLEGIDTDWHVRRDLLGSHDTDPHFIVEVEADGAATLRFGDGVHGERPATGTAFSATYRVGNGEAGNVAAGAIAHLLLDLPDVILVSNPLPASGGVEPEAIEEVRQRAPFAFRVQQRAVTPDDYSDLCRRRAGISRVRATVRWTGSWNTVFVTADRTCGCDVDEAFKEDLREYLEPFRMAGQDLDVDAPRFVPLEIDMRVCVSPGYFRSQVKEALLDVFSSRVLPDGRRGLFFPDNFTFGQSVYLSPLYAAAQAVDGVREVRILVAQRQGEPSTDATATGILTMDRLEVAQLDNDPNFPDRGIFRLEMEGGQ